MSNFLQMVIKCIVERETIDTPNREDGWTVTGHDQNYSYVAFNKYRGNGKKVIYIVSRRRNGIKLSLLTSVKHHRVTEFEEAVAHTKNGKWFKNNRDCGVVKDIAVSVANIDKAIIQVFNGLDELFVAYNGVVDIECAPKGKESPNIACVERLPILAIDPQYDLSWDGWEKFYAEWDEFVGNWFICKASPTDVFTKQLSDIFEHVNADARLNLRELPEPYYGHGEHAKCVIVHLNPGASCDGEDKKFFGGTGFLMTSFAEDCAGVFSRYAEKWSILKDSYEGCPASSVPGHDWWHESNRRNFIARFCGVMNLKEVFALEACPYHSKVWSGGLDRIEKHVISKVITPAAVVASNANNNCAVFVGGGFNKLISKVKGVEPIGRWRGTRVYSLYKLTLPSGFSESRTTTYLLVLNGMQGMWLPAKNDLNDQIEKEVKEIIRTGSCGIS